MAKCDEEDIRASADSQLLVQRYNITTNNMLCKDSQQQKNIKTTEYNINGILTRHF